MPPTPPPTPLQTPPPQHTPSPSQPHPPPRPRSCVELGGSNPLVQIHDQGAGGNCNVVKEIIYPLGAEIDVRAVKVCGLWFGGGLCWGWGVEFCWGGGGKSVVVAVLRLRYQSRS